MSTETCPVLAVISGMQQRFSGVTFMCFGYGVYLIYVSVGPRDRISFVAGLEGKRFGANRVYSPTEVVMLVEGLVSGLSFQRCVSALRRPARCEERMLHAEEDWMVD